MSKKFFPLLLIPLLLLLVAGCAQQPETLVEEVEVTRLVEVEVPGQTVVEEVEVTRLVEVPAQPVAEPVAAPVVEPVTEPLTAEAYADFLADNYEIGDAAADFTSSLFAVTGFEATDEQALPYPAEIDEMAEGLTALEAVLSTVHVANLDELAYTYPVEKVDATLANLEVDDELELARRQELATALDAGLVSPGWAQTVAWNEPIMPDFAAYLLGRTLEMTGGYQFFLGYAGDDDIYGRLYYAWESFDQVLMPEIQEPANQMIRDQIITGYNVKRFSHLAGEDPEEAVVYGHSDIEHAKQLIALLRSEDMGDVRVLLVPKTSAFLYLDEWGTEGLTPAASPTFYVEPFEDGNGIAYSKEYDIVFQFDDPADRDQFHEVILAYAKKDDAEEPGLITGSWWQPLYSTTEPIGGDYVEVVNNVAAADAFYLQSFSLPEASPDIVTAFEEAYPDLNVFTHDLWVNDAFWRYLMGESE